MLLCLVMASRECVRLALSVSPDANDVFASVKVQLAFRPDDDRLIVVDSLDRLCLTTLAL